MIKESKHKIKIWIFIKIRKSKTKDMEIIKYKNQKTYRLIQHNFYIKIIRLKLRVGLKDAGKKLLAMMINLIKMRTKIKDKKNSLMKTTQDRAFEYLIKIVKFCNKFKKKKMIMFRKNSISLKNTKK